MAKYPRKRLLIDNKVQGSLIARVVLYWVACVITIELLQLTWSILTGPEHSNFFGYFIHQNWAAVAGRLAICALLLVPISYDMLKLSNRFAGPVFRMRRTLQQVAEHGLVEPVRLRADDYWHDFADDLNAALLRLSDAQAPPPHVIEVEEEPLAV